MTSPNPNRNRNPKSVGARGYIRHRQRRAVRYTPIYIKIFRYG